MLPMLRDVAVQYAMLMGSKDPSDVWRRMDAFVQQLHQAAETNVQLTPEQQAAEERAAAAAARIVSGEPTTERKSTFQVPGDIRWQ